ncbi:hypothetical protein IW138_006212 [Coemansia sp. RSA 986]|nr:hypothetical protein IW138_006212 [Coemansia sp. RSA 986]
MDESRKAEAKSVKKQMPYIMKAVAIGLQLEDGNAAAGTKDTRPRRQSLTQRLGLQSLGKKGKGSEETTPQPEYATSSSPQSTPSLSEQPDESAGKDGHWKPSSLPTEHGIADSEASEDSQKQLKPKAPGAKQRSVKAECVEMVGEDLYVGTSSGHIVHYTVATAELEADEAPERFKVSSVDLKLGGKKVEQLIAFPALCKLVVLCGSTVVFYSLPELRPIASGSIPAIKGVSCIAYDERIDRSTTATGAILCVARMRSVHIYRLLATELRLEQEVAIDSSVASICQYGNYVCLADTETYKIFDLAKLRKASDGTGQLVLLPTQQPTKDPDTGRIIRPPRPRTLVVGPNEFMFLTSSGDQDTLGVIVTAMGEALRGTLQFSSYPKSIAYDDPYVIAVFASGQVEVFDTREQDQTLVQSFFDAALAEAEAEESSSRPRRICMASGFHVSTSVSRPEVLDIQEGGSGDHAPIGQPLIDAAELFGSGISPEEGAQRVRSDLDTKPWTDALSQSQHWRREVLGDNNPLAAENRAGRALSRFTEARIVVVSQDAALYALTHRPQLVVVDQLLHERRIEEAMAMVERALASDPTLSARNDEVAYCFQMAGFVCFKNMLLDDSLQYFKRGSLDPRALLHLFPDLTEYLGSMLVPFSRIPMASGLRRLFYDISDVQQLVHIGAEQLAGDDSNQVAALRETLKSNVLEVAQRYLEHCRAQMLRSGVGDQHPFAPDAFPVIDTVLVRLYVANKEDRKLRTLAASKDSGIVSDLACQFLMDTHNYYYCSLLYKAHGETAKVLDIWHRLLLQDEWEDSQFGGLAEYIEYVQEIEEQRTLLDEYYWLVDHENVDTSLQLLACLSDETVASVDADRVVQRTEATADDRPLRILIERLISANHPRAMHYMTYLVKAYVRQIRDHYHDDSHPGSRAERDAFACTQADDLSLSYREYLKSLCTTSEGARLRVQLVDTLCVSPPTYDARQVLEYIEAEANEIMSLERAVLLVVLDHINQAVDLLVNELGDYAGAELLLLAPESPQSLAQLLGTTTTQADEAHETMKRNVCKLISMYLEIGRKGHDEIASRLVARLLDRYFEFLDASILNDIPDHWPYSVAEPFVIRSLQLVKRRERQATVVRGLHESLAFTSKVNLVAETKDAGGILLDYSQTCAKCKKLLGSSAFVFEPETEQVKHISCT